MGTITLPFVTCSDPGSWPIRRFQRGRCSHIDSLMNDGRLLGTRRDRWAVVPSCFLKTLSA